MSWPSSAREFRSRPPVATRWLAGRGSCSTAWSMGKRSPAPSQSPKGRLLRDQIQSGDPDFLVTAAELITKWLGGQKSGQFHRWLQDTVGALRAKDRAVIEALHGLPVLIATTNYDGLIEEVTGRPHITWKEQAAVERWLRGETADAVLHLHGWWDQPESVVLSLHAYEDVTADEHAQAVLRCLRTRNTLLFIGCGGGLEDPNFSRLLQWATATFGASPYRHFRLCLDSEVEALAAEQRDHPWLFPVGYGDAHGKLCRLPPQSGPRSGHRPPHPGAEAGGCGGAGPRTVSRRTAEAVRLSQAGKPRRQPGPPTHRAHQDLRRTDRPLLPAIQPAHVRIAGRAPPPVEGAGRAATGAGWGGIEPSTRVVPAAVPDSPCSRP